MNGESTPSGAGPSLAGFYAARLDEDEAALKWYAEEVQNQGPQFLAQIEVGPSRLLREVAAGRAILAMYEEAAQHPYDLPEGVREGRDDPERERDQYLIDVLGDVLACLAAVYSDHPGYRDEWKP